MSNTDKLPTSNDERLVRDAIRLRTATAAADAAYDMLDEALTARGIGWSKPGAYAEWVASFADDAKIVTLYLEWQRLNDEKGFAHNVIDGRAKLAAAARIAIAETYLADDGILDHEREPGRNGEAA